MKDTLVLTNLGNESVAGDGGWIDGVQTVDIKTMGALLLLSSIRGDARRAELLLRLGANPNYQGGKYGDTALTAAAIMGKPEIVKLLITHHADVNIRDYDGGTPLIWATVGQHDELVQLLLDAGANPNIREKDGQSPLELAIEHNLNNIERILRAAGATE